MAAPRVGASRLGREGPDSRIHGDGEQLPEELEAPEDLADQEPAGDQQSARDAQHREHE